MTRRGAIERHLRELDRLGDDLAVLDRDIAQAAVDDPAVKRLLTITGVNLIVAAGLVAAIGDVRRFPEPQKLVSYVGLNPRVRQSGLGLAQHGRISKRGRSHARAMLVEAAWAAAKAPGPPRAFFLRIRARRGHQIAAVAVARKLAVLCWHLLTKIVIAGFVNFVGLLIVAARFSARTAMLRLAGLGVLFGIFTMPTYLVAWATPHTTADLLFYCLFCIGTGLGAALEPLRAAVSRASAARASAATARLQSGA